MITIEIILQDKGSNAEEFNVEMDCKISKENSTEAERIHHQLIMGSIITAEREFAVRTNAEYRENLRVCPK